MGALLSGLLAGGWSFLMGWVFPSALSLFAFTLVTRASGEEVRFIAQLHELSLAREALVLTLGAVVIALLLSALQTFLYRVLEGYCFSEDTQKKLIARQRVKRDRAKKKLDELEKRRNDGAAGRSLQVDLICERLRRYPPNDDEMAPTQLANGIRALELYGLHRFHLDSQTLWSELMGVAPDETRKEQEKARAGVDFFVALLYLSGVLGFAFIVIGVLDTEHALRLLLAAVVAWTLTTLWYRLAVSSTDHWYSSVQALVNLGRRPLAEALNLVLPATIEEERKMWKGVCWLVNEPYDTRISSFLERYSKAAQDRSPQPSGPTAVSPTVVSPAPAPAPAEAPAAEEAEEKVGPVLAEAPESA